jgi:hypothetical protein
MSSQTFSCLLRVLGQVKYFLKKIGMVHLLKETLKEKKESGI